MSAFRRILVFAKPYRVYLVLNILCNIMYSLLAIFSVGSLLPILKILFDNVEREPQAVQAPSRDRIYSFDSLQADLNNWISNAMVEHGSLTVLAWLCIFTVTLFALRNIFRYMALYFMVAFRSGVSRDLRGTLYDKMLKLPVAYFTDQRKGDLMTRISNDVDRVQAFTLVPVTELIRSPFMIISTLAILVYMNAQLTLAALIILPVMGFVISRISKSLKRDAYKAQVVLSDLLSSVEETLGASKIIKIFNAENMLSKRFAELNTEWRGLTNRVERKHDLSSPVSELLGSFTLILLVWFGGRLIISGQGLSGEAFLTFIGLFFQLLDPAKLLSRSISDISRGNASAERVLEILEADETVVENPNAVRKTDLQSGIEFKNVSFHYHEDEPVLENLSFVIPKGHTVALVGQSGSGKTTIANLLTRFYDVSGGAILIDGIDIRDLSLNDYRSMIGMVTQESVLFNDSINNNIRMGKPEATEAEIRQAAEVANAHEFIAKLPDAYATTIGEGGGKLSGGQKQRISIARAVLKNPPLMILDEATSALDTHSERLVQDALQHMMENRTSLVIAHRLSTIQNADNILVMNRGQIIEQGTHLDLMQKNGYYAKLIEMQGIK
ncbi:MAG: ABC transporter ATP-binding protein [Weeksellaceae bacterium]|nr:ABC transporter ATP-binding protein [Weeksellaceae bacterium]